MGLRFLDHGTSVKHSTPPSSYVDTGLIEELARVQDSAQWNLEKLVKLLRELNDNHQRSNQYSCHALLRTVLNHIPPIFGQEKFSQVAATHGGQTDKRHLRALDTFRAAADDVLHRTIRKNRDLIEMDDLPPRTPVNALVRIVIDALEVKGNVGNDDPVDSRTVTE